MTVLISGATGFVGGNIVDALLQAGVKVRVLLRPGSNARGLEDKKLQWAVADPQDENAQFTALEGVSHVIHCAGALMGLGYDDYYRGNVLYTRNLVSACIRRGGIKKFVFLSSQAAGGPAEPGKLKRETDPANPLSYYGQSKLEAEQIVAGSALPWIILRPVPVYGPGDREFLTLFRLSRGPVVPGIGNGRQRTNMIYVKDLVSVVLRFLENDQARRLYFVSGPGVFTQDELSRAVISATGGKAHILHLPSWIARFFGAANSFIARLSGRPRFLNRDKIREFLQEGWACSSDALLSDIEGLEFTGLEDGLRLTADWYREQGLL